MASTVYETISSWTDQADQFLLTGHSAGGAVAALLFAHFKLSGVLRKPCRSLFLSVLKLTIHKLQQLSTA